MTTWAEHIVNLYATLRPPKSLPNGIEWLYPQKQPGVMEIVDTFYSQYFSDTATRKLMLGINPGRFGAGVTGVNFTAPRQLTECGVEHPFKIQSEISAEFIYQMINAYGGPEAFYGDVFIGSVCPLGFVRGGKNINYYDDKDLLQAVKPFILKNLQKLIDHNVDRSVCYSIGGEKNYKFLSSINEEFTWFDKIVPLPHPRFIMQYKRKSIPQFIQLYLDALGGKA